MRCNCCWRGKLLQAYFFLGICTILGTAAPSTFCQAKPNKPTHCHCGDRSVHGYRRDALPPCGLRGFLLHRCLHHRRRCGPRRGWCWRRNSQHLDFGRGHNNLGHVHWHAVMIDQMLSKNWDETVRHDLSLDARSLIGRCRLSDPIYVHALEYKTVCNFANAHTGIEQHHPPRRTFPRPDVPL